MEIETDAGVFKSAYEPQESSISTSPKFSNYALQMESDDDDIFIDTSIDIKRFVERQHLTLDRFEYPRNGKEPGFVLIFNQENFNYSMTSRKGSRRDVNEIVLCLQRYGFNIDLKNILTDGSKDEIVEKLKEVSEMDLSEYNSLIVFFLTHGDDFNLLHTRDISMSTNEIWGPFAKCETLKNKPKMFVFQACKGDGFSTTGNVVNQSVCPMPSNIVPANTFSKGMIVPDMLIVYSTIEGNVAFRNPLTGSWFIQEMCKNFFAYGKRDDVVSLVTRTIKCVGGNYAHFQTEVYKKQMPMFISTLTRKFFLNRNKDRDLLLKLLKTQEEMLKELKDINENFKRYFNEEDRTKKK